MQQYGRPKTKPARSRTRKAKKKEVPEIEELEIVEKIEPGPSKEMKEISEGLIHGEKEREKHESEKDRKSDE